MRDPRHREGAGGGRGSLNAACSGRSGPGRWPPPALACRTWSARDKPPWPPRSQQVPLGHSASPGLTRRHTQCQMLQKRSCSPVTSVLPEPSSRWKHKTSQSSSVLCSPSVSWGECVCPVLRPSVQTVSGTGGSAHTLGGNERSAGGGQRNHKSQRYIVGVDATWAEQRMGEGEEEFVQTGAQLSTRVESLGTATGRRSFPE